MAAFVEGVDPGVVFDRDAGICGICHASVARSSDWHIDHIAPLARGGKHSYANVQLTHAKCNIAKGARIAA
jgi:5-methylcytosine-specific restriction endonuclease McrA